jgi:hypothetical protein
MKKQSKPVPPPAEPALSKSDKNLIHEFQAYLHLVVTAAQMGQSGRLAALPSPGMQGYCRMLAKVPGLNLAWELEKPVKSILEQISRVAADCYRPIHHKQVKDLAMQAELEGVLDQLDFALARILSRVVLIARCRVQTTKNCDLLVEAAGNAIGHGVEAAGLVRRFQELFPDDAPVIDGEATDGGFPGQFARDAYQRIVALDKLADEFPDQIKLEARQMRAWPMLFHRHTNNRRRFNQLARRLELGAEYPVDASEGARFRPETPLVRYLDPLIFRLYNLWCVVESEQYESVVEENRILVNMWWEWPEEMPCDEVLEVLRVARRLPPLNKTTAHAWAKKGLVPLILATDARDWNDCAAPVLQSIAKQKGVKSQATFKSRLLAAVSAALQRLARAE